MPEQATVLYSANCKPGIAVGFNREVRAKDVMSRQQAIHSIARACRVKRRRYAAFRNEADKNAVLDKLKVATNNQGTSSIPLVVTPIDKKAAAEAVVTMLQHMSVRSGLIEAVILNGTQVRIATTGGWKPINEKDAVGGYGPGTKVLVLNGGNGKPLAVARGIVAQPVTQEAGVNYEMLLEKYDKVTKYPAGMVSKEETTANTPLQDKLNAPGTGRTTRSHTSLTHP